MRVESREERVETGEHPPTPQGEGEGGEDKPEASGQQPLLTVASSSPRPEDLQSLWNRLAVPRGLMRWEGMSDKRRAAARESLKACPDLARWEAWLASELSNAFNLGQNDSGWRADVDWLLRVKSRDRVRDFDPAARPARRMSVQSTGMSDWSGHAEGNRVLTDEEIQQAMEGARR